MAAVKESGLGDRLFVAGYDLSGDIGSIQRIAGGPAAIDVTGIDKSGYERIGGLRNGGIDFTAWFDDQPGQAHPRLGSLPTTDQIVTYFHGATIGNACASMVGKQVNYDGNRGNDGAFTFSVNAVSSLYGMEWGQMLTAGKRTDTVATSPATGLDGGAATTLGAQAWLHVFSFTGTSVTVTLQDSADNSTFAAIASPMSFTAATGVTSERIAVSGTIRRYVRAITAGTFSSAVFAVQFTRNATAVVF
jgi:hypothetical protein